MKISANVVGWRVLFALGLGAWLAAATPAAVAATYAYRNDVFAYDTPSGSAASVTWHTTGASPACTNYPNGDDDWADITFPSGFTFTFAGVVYSGSRIYSNGMLAFGTDTSGYWRQYTNLTLPITAASGQTYTGCTNTIPSNLIIPYWTDIVAGTANNTTGASVQYELLGTAPNRRMVISWVNVKLYNTTTRYNFQVALYESPAGGLNSNFKYQYTTGSSTGSAATVGVQVSTTDSTLYSFNQAFIDPTVGSAILWYPANQLIGKGAEYRFDESVWNGTPGEVKDTSGNGQNAVKTGAASNVSNGKICRGGSFTANTSNTVIDAVATPITPASVGSMDFWFNSNVKWNSADAMLFDATTTAARPFFFMKTATGVLKFSVTDSSGTVLTVSSAAQTFALNTWHHVGVSWNLRPGTNQTLLQIFLDGALSTSLRATSNGSITPLSTLDIGDNRTSGVTPTGGTPNGANGLIDEVNIYATEIDATQALADMNATRSTCTVVDHFHVTHNGSAVACDITPVTIQAHDINHALISLSGVTLTLSTSLNHGNWSNITGGSIGPITNFGNGAATYVFSGESSVTFGLQDPTTVAESLTIGATSGTITTTSGSAATCTSADYTFGSTCNTPLSFNLAGFIFSASAGGSVATIPAQVAGVSSNTYYLRAVQTNTTTMACVAALSGANTVNVAYECNNPLTCFGSNLMSVNGGSATTIQRNNNGSVSGYTPVNMTFDANGNAPFTFNYRDVGQVTLYASKMVNSVTLTGSSSAFVVKPHHFDLSAIKCTTANATNCGAGALAMPTPGDNPGASNAAGASFIQAGKAFSVTVTARDASGNATPNYGQESTPEGVRLIPTLVAPTGVGTNNPAIGYTTGFGAFNNGVATGTDFNWGEVGIITLTPGIGDGDYLGAGDVTGTVSGNVGRFTPDHFDITSVTPGCSTFSYAGLMPVGLQPSIAGQPFSVSSTARSLSGTTTQNYDGTLGFSKDTTFSDAGNAANFTNNTLWAAGYSVGAGTDSAITYRFTSKETAPQTLTLRAVDTDNVSSAGHAELTTIARSGRVHIINAYGSELVNLPMPLRAEYYQNAATGWVTNTNDGCTSVALSSLTPTNPIPVVGSSPSKTTNASIAYVPVVTGDAGLQLSAPGSGGTGYVDLNASLSTNAWLRYDWGGTGTAIDPTGRATFGLYRGSLKSIYLRERY